MRPGVPDPRAVLRFTSLLNILRPQVVHSHMVHANLLARVARILRPFPVLVSTAHSIREGSALREWAYRLTDRFCDVTTHVCRAGMERYISVGAVPKERIRVIPNGVDTLALQPDPATRRKIREQLSLRDEFVWLAVGRLEEPKDYPTMLRAFATAQRTHSCVLLISGDGSQRRYLERLAIRLDIASKVHFLGLRRDVPKLMNAADAFVMSSLWEGLPMVLLEASAMRLPIVATNVGGTAEAVVNGQSGFLVPSGNYEALAGAMANIMRLPLEQRQAMGAIGRRHVEAIFSLDRVVEQWEQLYRDLLISRGYAGFRS